MKDNHRFYRLIVGHRGKKHIATIELVINKKRTIKWDYNNNGNEYTLALDFEDTTNWNEQSRRRPTGGVAGFGRKWIYQFEFEVDHDNFIVKIDNMDNEDLLHKGVIHAPGGGD